MFCFWNGSYCVEILTALVAVGVVGLLILIFCVWIFIPIIRRKIKKSLDLAYDYQQSNIDQSDKPDLADNNQQFNVDQSNKKDLYVGQKILYDTSGGYECNLIITSIEEDNSVYGYFRIDIPPNVEILDLHYDCSSESVFLSFKTQDGAKELYFDTDNPDELDEYDIYIDHIEAVKIQ